MRSWIYALLLALSCQPVVAAEKPVSKPPATSIETLDSQASRYRVSSKKPFEDVLQDLEFIITENNYRLTGRNNIGHAIAQNVGGGYPDMQILHFCSIAIAQQIVELNPNYLMHMPCKASVRQDGSAVVVEVRLIPENDPAMHDLALKINAMMREIADFAAD